MSAEQKRRKIKQKAKSGFVEDVPESGRAASHLLRGMKPYRPAGKKWILVMENDEIMQMVTRRILERAGYGVHVIDNGDETIECYQIAKYCGYHFTAVILDLNTPHGKGGVETIRKLREIDPEVRAIISTGNVADPVIMNYREYGFKSALAKPFKPKDLKQAIHDVL